MVKKKTEPKPHEKLLWKRENGSVRDPTHCCIVCTRVLERKLYPSYGQVNAGQTLMAVRGV